MATELHGSCARLIITAAITAPRQVFRRMPWTSSTDSEKPGWGLRTGSGSARRAPAAVRGWRSAPRYGRRWQRRWSLCPKGCFLQRLLCPGPPPKHHWGGFSRSPSRSPVRTPPPSPRGRAVRRALSMVALLLPCSRAAAPETLWGIAVPFLSSLPPFLSFPPSFSPFIPD